MTSGRSLGGFMTLAVVALAAAALLASPPRRDEAPREVVRHATREVDAGRAEPLRAALAARLRGDAGDRGAALGLATVERLTYDYGAAESRLRALAGGGEPADPWALHARLELARARDAQGLANGLVEEFRAVAAAARRFRDPAAEAEALFDLAAQVVFTDGVEAALGAVGRGLRALPRGLPELEASLRCRRGHLLALGARLPAAEREIRAGTELAQHAGDPRAEVICLRATANDQQLRGDVAGAIATMRQAVEVRRRIHDRSGLGIVLLVLGDYLRKTAEVGEAAALFTEALAEGEASHNLFVVAGASLAIGANALALNDHVAAGEHIERAIAAYDALSDRASGLLARSFRPFVSMAAGDLPLARRQVDEVLGWAIEVGDWQHVIALHEQRFAIELRAGELDAAARALDAADEVSRKQTPPLRAAELAYARARLALRRGELDVAQRGLEEHLAAADPADRLMRYELQARLAEVHARRGDLPRAEDALTRATDELEAWRAKLADRELRVLAFQASPQEVGDLNASVASVLGALAAGGRAEAAFDLAERRRARELADRLAQARALRATATPAPAGGATTPPERPEGRPVRAGDVARLLPDERTAIVEFVTGVSGAPTTALVVTRDRSGAARVRGRTLATADALVAPIARLHAVLEQGGAADALAAELGAALLEPLAELLGDGVTRLVIVPDGPLHRVPWDALRIAPGRWAVERYTTSLAPSAAIVAALWRDRGRATPRRPTRLLALADPVFPASPGESSGARAAGEEGLEPYRAAFDAAGGLPRLEASAREAQLVARYADEAEVRLRQRASAAYLKHADLARFDVVHVATHALVDDHAAARTALALAPGEGESGFVTATDLAALRLDASLVVLSACRTAGGVVVDGEGIQGLTAPLLQAGARAVVATEWRVGDRTMVPLLVDLYDALARGQPLADALRTAKLEALGRGAAPREWAALVSVGDPVVTVALERPAGRRWWVAVGAAAALLVGLGAVLRGRRARRGHATAAGRVSLGSS
jgi:CHAT domain-containing protein/tetratricopeptide (TPR) repeat protein